MRPTSRVLVIALATLLALLFAALWRARLPMAEALVLRAVAAAGVAGAEVAVVEIGPRGALLEQLRVGEAAAPDLSIERIALRYSLVGLLRGELSEVAVGGLRLRGRADEAGLAFGPLDALREPGTSADASAGGASLPPFGALILQDARVELATSGSPIRLEADGELERDRSSLSGRLWIRAEQAQRRARLEIRLPGGVSVGSTDEIPFAHTLSVADGRAQLDGDGRLRLAPPELELAFAGEARFARAVLEPADLAPELGALLAAAEGSVAIRGRLRADAEGVALEGRIETAGVDLVTRSGIAAQGLAGAADFAGPAPFRTREIGSLRFRRADVIGPFEDGEIRFRLRGSELEVVEASWSHAGGRLSTSGRFDLAAQEQRFTVQVAGVSLERLLELVDVADLSGSGSLSGSLPLVYDGERLRVRDGRLEAAAPGGVVRYAPASAAGGSLGLGEDVDVLAGALENFHYDTLRLSLSGSLDGEVELAIALHGRNPRFENGRRVELNAKVETKLPGLLRAGRSVTGVPDVIERRLRDRVSPDGS